MNYENHNDGMLQAMFNSFTDADLESEISLATQTIVNRTSYVNAVKAELERREEAKKKIKPEDIVPNAIFYYAGQRGDPRLVVLTHYTKGEPMWSIINTNLGKSVHTPEGPFTQQQAADFANKYWYTKDPK